VYPQRWVMSRRSAWTLSLTPLLRRHSDGKNIILATEWILWMSWVESNAYDGFRREQIGNSPEFDPELPLTRDFEMGLYS
jgi:hypothetical protein